MVIADVMMNGIAALEVVEAGETDTGWLVAVSEVPEKYTVVETVECDTSAVDIDGTNDVKVVAAVEDASVAVGKAWSLAVVTVATAEVVTAVPEFEISDVEEGEAGANAATSGVETKETEVAAVVVGAEVGVIKLVFERVVAVAEMGAMKLVFEIVVAELVRFIEIIEVVVAFCKTAPTPAGGGLVAVYLQELMEHVVPSADNEIPVH
ncbi:hypothetical protein HDU98_003937 [Podochytrium sp. JEL0797]|nr:hypothetical protein HDU98_003937 [Podochytrium sp. JEL0797]